MEHTYGIEQGGNYREQGRLISLLRDLTEPDRALLESRLVDGWGLCRHRSSLGHPARRPGETRSANTDRASPEGKGARSRREPVRPGGVNVRLKCSPVKARLPHVYDGNGAGRSTRTGGVYRRKNRPVH